MDLEGIYWNMEARRKRRKKSLKQREVPPLYFNSQLTRAKGQRPQSHLHKSAVASPEVRRSKVKFSNSPSEQISLSPEPISQPTAILDFPHRPLSLRSILRKSTLNRGIPSTPSIGSQSPAKCQSPVKSQRNAAKSRRSLTSSRLSYIDKLVRDLSPEETNGIRGVVARCRVKTRQFYHEIQRQAAMSEDEIQREKEHEEYFQKVIRGRNPGKKAVRQSLQK